LARELAVRAGREGVAELRRAELVTALSLATVRQAGIHQLCLQVRLLCYSAPDYEVLRIAASQSPTRVPHSENPMRHASAEMTLSTDRPVVAVPPALEAIALAVSAVAFL